MKKTLSLLIVLCLVFGAFAAGTACADETAKSEESESKSPCSADCATMNKSRPMGIYLCMKSGCRVSGEDFARSKITIKALAFIVNPHAEESAPR